MRRLSPREAHALMVSEGYAYLDVRSVPEFDEAHPHGAYNVPLDQSSESGLAANPSFAREVARLFAKDARIVVGCAVGVRSVEAALRLQHAGFTQVVEQRAGMLGVRDPFGRVREKGWRDEGLPTSTQAEPGHSYREIESRAGCRE
jgi:rhodanese-related sulfurtransferase